jgi:hypothetical protein
MPKWKKNAREFTVSVNFNVRRGYQAIIPKPVMDHLSRPTRITFTLSRERVEVRAAGKG